MNRTLLRFHGATIVCGRLKGDALVGVTLHQSVNSDTEYTVGSACADYIEVELWANPSGSLRIKAGDELTLEREKTGGFTKYGIFIAEKPTRTKRNTYKITAYDRMTKLDKNLSSWLRENQSAFPMTLWALVQAVCTQCGVKLASTSLPDNGDYSVRAFYADDVTGRQIISWAAEAAGCYAHMTAAGKLEFARFTASAVSVAPAQGDSQTAYYADSLSYEDYAVKAIEKVQIRQSDSDVGVIYPDSTDALNTYVVQGNLLLTTDTEENLKPVAKALYTALSGVTYTPCRFSVPANAGLAVGQTATVTGPHGSSFTTYLFSSTIRFSAVSGGGKATFESTGSASRDSASAVNHKTYKNLTGKMLEIETSVDGLSVKAGELSGDYSELKQTVDGFSATVSATARTVAEEVADDKLTDYSTTAQMNSAISQKADSITSTVSATYTTKSELNDTLGNYPTTTTVETKIAQTVNGITLSAANGGSSSTLTLKSGSTTLSSADITFSGVVTFYDLSNWQQDKTVINGGNITTGQLHNKDYTTVYDLDNAIIRMGPETGTRVWIDRTSIQWFGGTATSSGTAQGMIQNGLQTTAAGDTTIFGADTRYQKYGWYHGGSFQGITVEQVDNEVQVPNLLSVGHHISCESITAWGTKERAVRTAFGVLGMNAVESPEPMFCDAGSGECDETGVCCIVTEPRYRETLSETQELRWTLTPTGQNGALWAEKTAFGAVVHGDAGQRFDWVCWGVQRGFEGVYADVSGGKYPEQENRGAYLLNAAEAEAAIDLPLTVEEAG